MTVEIDEIFVRHNPTFLKFMRRWGLLFSTYLKKGGGK